MSRTRIALLGKLEFSEGSGFRYSVSLGKPGKETTIWLEALPNAHDWPGLGKFPDQPKPKPLPSGLARKAVLAANKAADDAWRRACEAYYQALHADRSYQEATRTFLERQRHDPQLLDGSAWWIYRDKVLRVESTEPQALRDRETDALFVKQYVLRRERHYERVRREVEALENLERLDHICREPIPESVRLFVWQRDKGQCVTCGTREHLEFDHIIPIVAGGANTERNVQILCQSCNRSKGATI